LKKLKGKPSKTLEGNDVKKLKEMDDKIMKIQQSKDQQENEKKSGEGKPNLEPTPVPFPEPMPEPTPVPFRGPFPGPLPGPFGQTSRVEPSTVRSSTFTQQEIKVGEKESFDNDNKHEDAITEQAQSRERQENPNVTDSELASLESQEEQQRVRAKVEIANQNNLATAHRYTGGHRLDNPTHSTRTGQPLAPVQYEPVTEQKSDVIPTRQFDQENFEVGDNIRPAGSYQPFYNDQLADIRLNPFLNEDPSQSINDTISRALMLNKEGGFYNTTLALERARTLNDRMVNLNKSAFNKEMDLSRSRPSFGSSQASQQTMRDTPVSWRQPDRRFRNSFVGLVKQGVGTANRLSQEFLP
jgi:hypothetical protein